MTKPVEKGGAMAPAVGFPGDWLGPSSGGAASDLDLAVLVVNSYDALDDPPDRLQDLTWLTAVFSHVGHSSLADHLLARDLEPLHALRSGLRSAFEAVDVATAASVLNPMMEAADAVPLLVTDPREPGTVRLAAGVERQGLEALQARLPVAVAQHIVAFGLSRLGACGSEPCHCVFVDRTRAGTRRYCCTWCNDRAAARAYRRRRRSS